MTCVCAFVEKNGLKKTVHMIGDSCGSADQDRVCRADNKVFFQKRNDLIMGYSGSYRIGQIARFDLDKLKKRPHGVSLLEWMCGEFVTGLRAALIANGIEGKEMDGSLMVGIDGQIFTIDQDFHVGQNLYPYAATGAAESYAYGAMRAMHAAGHTPKECLDAAMEAAAEFCGAVMAPFTYLRKTY